MKVSRTLKAIFSDNTKIIHYDNYEISTKKLDDDNYSLSFKHSSDLETPSLIRHSHKSSFKYADTNKNCLFSSETGSGKSWKIALITLDLLLQGKSVMISHPKLLTDQIHQTFLQIMPQDLFVIFLTQKLLIINHDVLFSQTCKKTDCLIIDEAHQCLENERSKMFIEKLFKEVKTIFLLPVQ